MRSQAVPTVAMMFVPQSFFDVLRLNLLVVRNRDVQSPLRLFRMAKCELRAQRSQDPVRTLKIAGPLGLGITATLYIFANIAYFAYVRSSYTSEEDGPRLRILYA